MDYAFSLLSMPVCVFICLSGEGTFHASDEAGASPQNLCRKKSVTNCIAKYFIISFILHFSPSGHPVYIILFFSIFSSHEPYDEVGYCECV